MQAPKNGFFYVVDRTNGEFIHAKNYVNVTWATGVDPKTGRPIEVPEARFLKEPAMVAPGPIGAHNWYPMSFNPVTNLVYIPALESASYYAHDEKFEFRDKGWNTGIGRSATPPNAQSVAAAAKSKGSGFLLAWDPVNQREAWRVSYGRGGNGGTLSTAGNLVFQGSADGYFNAYAADTGVKKCSQIAQNGVMSGPMTFELDNEQYVVALAGIGGVALGGGIGGGGSRSEFGRVLAFKLAGKAQLPTLRMSAAKPLPNLASAEATGNAERGERRYEEVCSTCHGARARSVTAVPTCGTRRASSARRISRRSSSMGRAPTRAWSGSLRC
jgi:quinohemoprotein ethanol dehydrogenase